MVETATVKTLKSFLTTRHRIELDVDVTISVRIDSNVHNFAVLLVALGSDFSFEVFNPIVAPGLLFPVSNVSLWALCMDGDAYSSGSKAFSILIHFEAIGLSTTGARGLLTTGAAPCLAGSAGSRRASASISLERS